MEIGPITGVRSYPTARFKERETEMPAVFEVEYLGRAGDESYASNHGNEAPGSDSEDGHADRVEPDVHAGQSPEVTRVNQVNLFA